MWYWGCTFGALWNKEKSGLWGCSFNDHKDVSVKHIIEMLKSGEAFLVGTPNLGSAKIGFPSGKHIFYGESKSPSYHEFNDWWDIFEAGGTRE